MKISMSNDRGTLDVEFPEIEGVSKDEILDLKCQLLPFLNAKIKCDRCQGERMRLKGEMVIEEENGLYITTYTCPDCQHVKRLDGCFNPQVVIWGRPGA